MTGTSAAFDAAVDQLHDLARTRFSSFFEKYPDLEPLYDAFDGSTLPVAARRTVLLADFLPDLRRRLQRQQAHQLSAARLEADTTTTRLLLEDPALLHADGRPGEPADSDLVGVAANGVSARYFFGDDVTGPPALTEPTTHGNIAFRPTAEGGAALPANGDNPGQPISARWSAYLLPPDNGAYNLRLDSDAAGAVELLLDGQDVPLVEDGPGVLTNQQAIELAAGKPRLLELTTRELRERAVLSWQRKGLAREPIPVAHLLPAEIFDHFAATYMRLLKTLAVSHALRLETDELAYLAGAPQLRVDDEAWPNALPTEAGASPATSRAVFAALTELLRYRRLTGQLKIRNGELAEVLQDPTAVVDPGKDDRSRLEVVTGWDPAFTDAYLTHLGWTLADLKRPDRLRRLAEAGAVARALGVGATALDVTTNDPDSGVVIRMQQALRGQHDHDRWLDVVRPVSDAIREQQRDALVATMLHRLGEDDATRHIDTADKLYEHLLIDVQMAACMQTSRVRQAIATVQHFVQRCLLNLEPRVAPSSIKSERWRG